MLGNSFTLVNNMPETLANLINGEIVQYTCHGSVKFKDKEGRFDVGCS